MTSTTSPAPAPAAGAAPSPKQQFLAAYDREHAITMKVLRAFPPEQAELRPHPKCKTARELAWIFVLERGLATAGLANAFASGNPGGPPPDVPESWDAVLSALEAAHLEFRKTFSGYSDAQLLEPIKFFGGPATLVDMSRMDFVWFVMSDQIHHRGQLSVYLRMAGGKVPSIYGPSGDEPWF
jgi:uncharacterized damage-inducible protein DinB